VVVGLIMGFKSTFKMKIPIERILQKGLLVLYNVFTKAELGTKLGPVYRICPIFKMRKHFPIKPNIQIYCALFLQLQFFNL